MSIRITTWGSYRSSLHVTEVTVGEGVYVTGDIEPHGVDDMVALVQEQMAQLAAAQQKRSALTATGTAANGTIEVTVDANRTVTKTVVGEAYLEDFELADIGGHITTAAQAAARAIEQDSAALLAPLTERRNEILSYSRPVGELPGLKELMAVMNSPASAADHPQPVDDGDDDWTDNASYPTVRR